MQWPKASPRLPESSPLGGDIMKELIPESELPDWPDNDMGSSSVPALQIIKMKDPDFAKWCPYTFQTTMWVGTATPSKRSQQKNQYKFWWGKNKGKGKDKGKVDRSRGRGG